MKKILLSILGIFFGLSTFCSADFCSTMSSNFSWWDDNFSLYGLNRTISGGSFVFNTNVSLTQISFATNGPHNGYYSIYDDLGNLKLVANCNDNDSYEKSICNDSFCCYYSGNAVSFSSGKSYNITFTFVDPNGGIYARSFTDRVLYFGYNHFLTYNSFEFDNGYCYFPFLSIVKCENPYDTFIVNYGNQSKEYTITDDVDIYINSPVSKDGSIFTFDGSTGINLVYNGQYNWYTKNKLYLDGQFWYRQGVFTPICL